jgi:hypothetical protein
LCKAGREDPTFPVDFYNPLCYQLVLPERAIPPFWEKGGAKNFWTKVTEIKKINYYVNRQTDRRIN